MSNGFDPEISPQIKSESTQSENKSYSMLKRRFKAQVELTNKRPKIRVFNIKQNEQLSSVNKTSLNQTKNPDLTSRIKTTCPAQTRQTKESMS